MSPPALEFVRECGKLRFDTHAAMPGLCALPVRKSYIFHMNKLSAVLAAQIVAHRRWILLALLAVLHLVLWQGVEQVLGKALFVAHLGLAILWQPFIHGEKRLSLRSLLLVVVAISAAIVFLSNWLLAVWIVILAGLVGGKVLLFGSHLARWFYLLALGFLVAALLLLAVPRAAAMMHLSSSMSWLAHGLLPAILLSMALLPQQEEDNRIGEVTDFVYSLFIVLLLAVLMLGSLAIMSIFNKSYAEALLQVLLIMGLTLLLLGWTWNPHIGFSGVGSLFARYVMSIGLPVEQWLKALADLAQSEDDPEMFLEQACVDMAKRLPWVAGGSWRVDGGDGGDGSDIVQGRFGHPTGRRSEFAHGELKLSLFTQHPLSPTLIWHFNLLAQLLAEFYADKQRARALKHLSYLQAVHETGARLTHDVKNLLQSLNTLCAAVCAPDAAAQPGYQALLQRQLPAISRRLTETLAKLRAPHEIATIARIAARRWCEELRQRTMSQPWITLSFDPTDDRELPAEAFSSIVDNLIRNANEKRLREPGLTLAISLRPSPIDPHSLELRACDNGAPLPAPLASRLLRGPVASENGLGIGLYQAARLAESVNYRLVLERNRLGDVCFLLKPATPAL